MTKINDPRDPDKGGAPSSGPPPPPPPATPSAWAKAASSNPTGTGYSPDKFYVSSTDVKGHGDRVTVKLPPEVIRNVRILVDTGAFPPYQAVRDFIADAIHHHLHTRAGQIGDPTIRESLQRLFVLRDMQERLDEATRDSELWASHRLYWDKTFAQLARDGAWDQLRHHVLSAIEVANRAAEPYRGRMLAILADWLKRIPEESGPPAMPSGPPAEGSTSGSAAPPAWKRPLTDDVED